PWTDRVREATEKAIVGVGRYTSADLMAEIVRTRALDIIGAARPAIADPFLPTKIREGRLDEIRECTGSNVCIAREETYNQVACIQNATAGEEFRRGWHPELFTTAANADRAVLVVGAGPAGMECAIILGKRGFEAVHLVDEAAEIGGRLRWTRQLPTLGDWGRVTDYRVIQLDKLENVEVITGRRLDAAAVRDYGAQIVIMATGSTWRGDGVQPEHDDIDGADMSLPHVMTPEQVMLAGKRPTPGPVVVYDADGYYVGPGIAEQLAGEGFDVHLVTPFGVVSPTSDASLEGDMLRQHLHEQGVTAHRGVTVTEITTAGVTGVDEFGQPWSTSCAGVVLVTQQQSEDTLYRDLLADPAALRDAGIEAVYATGDAVAPRPISESVFDGHRLAREIDSDDPMRPTPYERERIAL
ncbi:MAG: NAD(P)-binding protein, partial [Actinomycetes bacterium]